MAQFTPYYGNYFQLHGMTKDITLFKKGLVKDKVDPKLPNKFLDKIELGWDEKEVKERTNNAINHISKFMPSFKKATPTKKPLYGAQQIPGENPELRAAEISFEKDEYARCEIVKANSIFAMANEILKKLQKKGVIKDIKEIDFSKFELNKEDVDKLATKIAKERGYPQEMGYVINSLTI